MSSCWTGALLTSFEGTGEKLLNEQSFAAATARHWGAGKVLASVSRGGVACGGWAGRSEDIDTVP